MYDECSLADQVKTQLVSYTVEVEDEDGEMVEEDREIKVSLNDLECVGSTSQGERGMGEEVQHTYQGTVEDEDGNEIEVEIEVYEYPIGAVNYVESKARVL